MARHLFLPHEVLEADRRGRPTLLEQREPRDDLAAVRGVLQFEVPLAGLLLPAVADRAAGHARLSRFLVVDEELPLAVLLGLVARHGVGAQQLPRPISVTVRLEAHQEGRVAEASDVILEEGRFRVRMKFLEDDVVDRHPEGAVLSGVHRYPLIGVLRDLIEVGGEDHHLRPVVPRLCRKVAIRRTSHVEVRPDHGRELRVVPIGALGDVGLLSPDLRRSWREIAIPVVEAQTHAAHELEKARAARVAEHRHRGDGREARDAVGPIFLDGVDVRGGDHLHQLGPVRTAQAALPARVLVGGARLGIGLDRSPSLDRVVVGTARITPQVEQDAARVWVLHANRRVQIPTERDAPLTPARLVGGKRRIDLRVIERLHLPGDDPLLDVDVPRAAARAVHAMRAAHHLVVLPPVSIELLPGA